MYTLDSYITNKGYKVSIGYCDYEYAVRDFIDDCVHFHFTDRDCEWVNDLDINRDVIELLLTGELPYLWDDDKEYIEELAEETKQKYWIYPINIYEHSWYAFSIGYRHGFDDRFWWALLIDKEKRREYGMTDDEPTNEYLDEQMDILTKIRNGRVYDVSVYQEDIYRNDKWNELTQREYIDGISGILDDNLKKAYNDEFWETYGIIE